jgi:IS5 family transposase
MARQAGLFDIEERLRELSAKGDDLERINALVDFEAFRPELERAVPQSDRARGGHPPYDHVLMFRILILQASHSLSDKPMESLVKDRLSARTLPRAEPNGPGSERDLDLELP